MPKKKKKIEKWEKAMDKQWEKTDHYAIWGWWVKDMVKKLLQSEKERWQKELRKEYNKWLQKSFEKKTQKHFPDYLLEKYGKSKN